MHVCMDRWWDRRLVINNNSRAEHQSSEQHDQYIHSTCPPSTVCAIRSCAGRSSPHIYRMLRLSVLLAAAFLLSSSSPTSDALSPPRPPNSPMPPFPPSNIYKFLFPPFKLPTEKSPPFYSNIPMYTVSPKPYIWASSPKPSPTPSPSPSPKTSPSPSPAKISSLPPGATGYPKASPPSPPTAPKTSPSPTPSPSPAKSPPRPKNPSPPRLPPGATGYPKASPPRPPSPPALPSPLLPAKSPSPTTKASPPKISSPKKSPPTKIPSPVPSPEPPSPPPRPPTPPADQMGTLAIILYVGTMMGP